MKTHYNFCSRFLLVLLLSSSPISIYAKQKRVITHPSVEVPYLPWFTGPIFSPTPINMKPGHPAIEPSVIFMNTYGNYNSNWDIDTEKSVWSINPVIDFQFAFSERTGLETVASLITNFRDGQSSTHFQDTLVFLGYQVADDQISSWVPDFRLVLEVIFPSGNYRGLNPSKKEIDLTGQGAYFFGPNLAFQKLFYLPKNFFVLRWALGYFFPTRAYVKGFNAYGGGFDTRGNIRPGQILQAFLSGEYSFNQRWVFEFDTQFYFQRSAGKFHGRKGVDLLGNPARVDKPFSVQISFAPGIEYNINKNSGLILGSWFTLFGKNTEAFASILLTYLYVF